MVRVQATVKMNWKVRWLYAFFDNGEKITDDMRSVYRSRSDLQQTFPNPFTTFCENDSFYHWWISQYPKEISTEPKDESINNSKLLDIRSEIYEYLLGKAKNELPNEYIPLSSYCFVPRSQLINCFYYQFHPIPENDGGKGFPNGQMYQKLRLSLTLSTHLPGGWVFMIYECRYSKASG
jgi:hypothetical protein